MKTILRIIIILLVASVVAGAFSLAINNGTTASNTDAGQSPVTNAGGQSFQPMTRPEGDDHDNGSIAGGLAGIFGTVAKLTGITVLVLALQKAFTLLGNRKFISMQR